MLTRQNTDTDRRHYTYKEKANQEDNEDEKRGRK